MFTRSLLISLGFTISLPFANSRAEEPAARVVTFHGYTQAIELKLGKTRGVLCPQAGGRVLEFSVDGVNALYLDDEDKKWQPGKPGPSSAGRFDYGPELVVTPHPKTWSGEWTGEIVKAQSARLMSQREDEAGIELVREFSLVPHGEFVCLKCKQT